MERLKSLAARQTATDAFRDLESRIRLVSARWSYTPEELAEALCTATAELAGWLRLVEHDEHLAKVRHV